MKTVSSVNDTIDWRQTTARGGIADSFSDADHARSSSIESGLLQAPVLGSGRDSRQ